MNVQDLNSSFTEIKWEPVTEKPILRMYLLSYSLFPHFQCPFSLILIISVPRLFFLIEKAKAKQVLRNVLMHCLVGSEQLIYFFPIPLSLWNKLKKKKKNTFWKGVREAPLLVPVIIGNFHLFLGFLILGEKNVYVCAIILHLPLQLLDESSLKFNLPNAFMPISSFYFALRWFVITQLSLPWDLQIKTIGRFLPCYWSLHISGLC